MFAQRFKEMRIDRDLSQAEMANILSVSPSTIGMYEQGRRVPDAETLIKIARYFSVTTDYLLGETDTKSVLLEGTYGSESTLSEKDIKEVRREAEKIKDLLLAGTDLAFDGKIEDEKTLDKVMAALESGMRLAKEEAKAKYTPKKYRKQK